MKHKRNAISGGLGNGVPHNTQPGLLEFCLSNCTISTVQNSKPWKALRAGALVAKYLQEKQIIANILSNIFESKKLVLKNIISTSHLHIRNTKLNNQKLSHVDEPRSVIYIWGFNSGYIMVFELNENELVRALPKHIKPDTPVSVQLHLGEVIEQNVDQVKPTPVSTLSVDIELTDEQVMNVLCEFNSKFPSQKSIVKKNAFEVIKKVLGFAEECHYDRCFKTTGILHSEFKDRNIYPRVSIDRVKLQQVCKNAEVTTFSLSPKLEDKVVQDINLANQKYFLEARVQSAQENIKKVQDELSKAQDELRIAQEDLAQIDIQEGKLKQIAALGISEQDIIFLAKLLSS